MPNSNVEDIEGGRGVRLGKGPNLEDDGHLSRAEYAYTMMLEGIRRGDFRPTQRLREAEIAARLNISRTPVREAMRRLSADGLIEIAPGRGMMITQFDKSQVRQLYFLRKVLEGAAAGLAAHHATKEDIALMRLYLQKSERSRMQPGEMAKLNQTLHQTIHEAARNAYVTKALAQLSDSLALLPGTTFEYPNRIKQAWAEHRAIIDAIEAGDAVAAEDLARRHIEQASLARIAMMFAG